MHAHFAWTGSTVGSFVHTQNFVDLTPAIQNYKLIFCGLFLLLIEDHEDKCACQRISATEPSMLHACLCSDSCTAGYLRTIFGWAPTRHTEQFAQKIDCGCMCRCVCALIPVKRGIWSKRDQHDACVQVQKGYLKQPGSARCVRTLCTHWIYCGQFCTVLLDLLPAGDNSN